VLTYRPGDTLAHGFDPRAKLALQAGFAATMVAHPTPRWAAGGTGLALLALLASRTPLSAALWAIRLPAGLLAAAAVLEALTLGPPWVSVAAARQPAIAGYRVVLVLLVSVAYVRTTPIRATRAAIQRTIPGKPGQFLGVGVALVARFLPVLRSDLERSRAAARARLGDRRRLDERMATVALGGLSRALGRADRLAIALRARAFAWNPTLPPLAFRARDHALTLVGVALAASAAI
jgi:biotin transport system permease protein